MATELSPAFWDLIARARGENDPMTPSAPAAALGEVLAGLDDAALLAFDREFQHKLIELNRWSVWGAGYVIAGGMSDDHFLYFRCWLIGKGEAAFGIALTEPDALGPYVDDPDVDNEELLSVVSDVMAARNLEIPEEQFESPDEGPSGEPFDEESVDGLYPRLATIQAGI